MMCDERDVPLNEFETAILAELLAAQTELDTTLAAASSSKIVAIGARHRRGPVQVTVAAAAAVVVTIGAVALAARHPDTASATPALPHLLAFGHGSTAEAVAVLERAAAAQDHAAVQRSGPVNYAKTQNYALQVTVSGHRSTTVVETTVRQVWRSARGAALVREYRQDTEPAGGDVGGPKALGGLNHSGSYKPGGWADPNVGFPTNYAAALAALHNPNTDGNAELTTITSAYEIGEHLSVGSAIPAQTAALYRVLARLPGLFDAGTVTDNAGRIGRAVGIVTSGPGSLATGTRYFIVAPSTGQFLETEVVDTPGPPPALHLPSVPTVEEYEVVLATGQVAAAGKVPAGAGG